MTDLQGELARLLRYYQEREQTDGADLEGSVERVCNVLSPSFWRGAQYGILSLAAALRPDQDAEYHLLSRETRKEVDVWAATQKAAKDAREWKKNKDRDERLTGEKWLDPCYPANYVDCIHWWGHTGSAVVDCCRCESGYTTPAGLADRPAAVRWLADDGWLFSGEKALCPQCVAALREKRGDADQA